MYDEPDSGEPVFATPWRSAGAFVKAEAVWELGMNG